MKTKRPSYKKMYEELEKKVQFYGALMNDTVEIFKTIDHLLQNNFRISFRQELQGDQRVVRSDVTTYNSGIDLDAKSSPNFQQALLAINKNLKYYVGGDHDIDQMVAPLVKQAMNILGSLRSKCCSAPVKVGGKGTSAGSTHWYVCEKCDEACDLEQSEFVFNADGETVLPEFIDHSEVK